MERRTCLADGSPWMMWQPGSSRTWLEGERAEIFLATHPQVLIDYRLIIMSHLTGSNRVIHSLYFRA